jgi:hypothetical protein
MRLNHASDPSIGGRGVIFFGALDSMRSPSSKFSAATHVIALYGPGAATNHARHPRSAFSISGWRSRGHFLATVRCAYYHLPFASSRALTLNEFMPICLVVATCVGAGNWTCLPPCACWTSMRAFL